MLLLSDFFFLSSRQILENISSREQVLTDPVKEEES